MMEEPKQRFIVTREEIQNYGKQRERFRDATFGSPCQPLFEAEQAVFKRPVPEWATHLAHVTIDGDGHSQSWWTLHKAEEIPK